MKILNIICLLMITTYCGLAQTDLSFYNMYQTTPQANSMNPAFFPEARVTVSLPVLSGIYLNAGTGLSYSEIFTADENSDSVFVDFDKMISNMDDKDQFSFSGSISLFQLGIKIKDKHSFSLFANERFGMSVSYPRSSLDYFLGEEGNLGHINETVNESRFFGKGIHYREYGLGYAHKLNVPLVKSVTVGSRVKYLQGVFNFETSENANISLTTYDDYSMNIAVTDPRVNTAGFETDNMVDYLISNDNVGFGIDLGVDVEINDKLSASLAFNDLGRIKWTESVENYYLTDSELILDGMDLSDIDGFADAIGDSLDAFTENGTDSIAYSTRLNSRYIGSARYKLTKKGFATASVMVKNDFGNYSTDVSVGYTQQFGNILTLSSSVSHYDGRGVSVGAGMALHLGILQVYTSFDNLLGLVDVRDVDHVQGRVGVNFLFGRGAYTPKEKKSKPAKQQKSKPAKKEKGKSEISPFPAAYDLDHLDDVND